jgi:hypothetical protein
LDYIRASGRDRLDVRSLNFGPTASVDDFQAGYGAAIVIGSANLQSKVRVTYLAVDQHLLDAAIYVLRKPGLIVWRWQVYSREIEAKLCHVFRPQGIVQAG